MDKQVMVFDVKWLIDTILSSHRLTKEELESIVRGCFILGLKEFYRSGLWRYQHHQIDENIWTDPSVFSLEDEIEEEMLTRYYYRITTILDFVCGFRSDKPGIVVIDRLYVQDHLLMFFTHVE